MKRWLYILPILLLPMMVGAKERVYDPDSIYMLWDVDKYAKLTVTQEEWQRYMTDSLRYPEDARAEGVEGEVFVNFIIERDGSYSNITVSQSSGDQRLDKEAIRLVASRPRWEPAMILVDSNQYKAVRTRSVTKIRFILPEPLDSLVQKIAQCSSYALTDDNGWGNDCFHYTLTQKLKLSARFDQLDSLANYGKNSMLRLTAFNTMTQKEYKEEATGHILPIVLKMLEDTSEVYVNSYDNFWNESTSSLALNIATASDLLSPAESAYLDSLVLWTDRFAYNDRFYRIVEENLGREDIYQRIRDLYLKNGIKRLLSYLAWYRNPQDETLLIEALNDYKNHINQECIGGGWLTGQAMDAIQYWPSPAFREAIAEYRTTYALCNHFGHKELVMMFYYILQQDPAWGIPFIHETMDLCLRNPHGRETSYTYFRLYVAHRMLGNSAYDEAVRQYQSEMEDWQLKSAEMLAKSYLQQQIQKKR